MKKLLLILCLVYGNVFADTIWATYKNAFGTTLVYTNTPCLKKGKKVENSFKALAISADTVLVGCYSQPKNGNWIYTDWENGKQSYEPLGELSIRN